MTMTVIERIARVLCAEEYGDENAMDGDMPLWENYVDTAKQVIEAMREPSTRMIGAATGVPIQSNVVSETYVLDEEATAIWQAMITTALEENGE